MPTKIESQTIAALYGESARNYASNPAFSTRVGKDWQSVNFSELYETGLNLATGLIHKLGVQQREHVALMADNRLEWIIADYGIQLAGAADVPRGTDVTPGDIEYIIPHSDAKVVFVEHVDMLRKINESKSKLTNVQHIVIMDKSATAPEGVVHMYDLIEEGKQLRASGDKAAEERIANVKPEDIYTLIYTSGTTGAPKGVQLTHANAISQLIRAPLEISPKDRILSILPVWHIFERGFEMLAVAYGVNTYYTNVRNIGEDLRNVKPTFMGSAPRLWENIYQKIESGVKSAPAVRRNLFNAAYFCSRMFKGSMFFLRGRQIDMEGRNPIVSLVTGIFHILRAILFLIPNFLLDAIVLKKIRAATGGEFRGSVSGGGALPLHVDEFFNYIGVPVLEGYGMTETSPTLAVRTFDSLVIGTVGPIFTDTYMRLVELGTGDVLYSNEPGSKTKKRGVKGEIHVKGPQVMKGYYKNQEATDKVLRDGWMNTGDIGMITYNDCVKIMGRSKETVVLSGGENVEPVPIENAILNSPYVEHCMIVGQDQKFLAALIVPSLEEFQKNGNSAKDLPSLAADPAAQKVVQGEIKRLVGSDTGFKSFERVPDCRLVPKPFEVGDEITNLFKLKRHVITEKYQDKITDIYG